MDLKITPSGQTIVKPTALGPGANTDTKLLIYGLFQKGRVLAQDGVIALRVEGVSISSISRIEGIAWNTVAPGSRTVSASTGACVGAPQPAPRHASGHALDRRAPGIRPVVLAGADPARRAFGPV